MAEVLYLQEGGALVTNARIVIGGKTYVLSGISSVSAVRIDPKIGGDLFAAIIGAVGLLIALSNFASWWPNRFFGDFPASVAICGGVGLLLAGAGILNMRQARPRFAARIVSASGENDALVSKDEAQVDRLVEAINKAIIERAA